LNTQQLPAGRPLTSGPPAVLGISAKSSDISEAQKARYLSARRGKFELLRTAGSLLFRPDLPAAEQHRTCWCHRGTPAPRGAVSVYRRETGDGARLQGVTTCGNVWTCPVCSARVAEARREELETALKGAVAQGYAVYLMTLTFPHEAGDALADLLAKQADALVRFKRGRTFRELKTRFKRKGSVRSMELTHGDNGWHPHTHDLVFAMPGLEGDRIFLDQLRRAWLNALTDAGLLPADKWTWAWQHAFDLRGGEKAGEYVSKFGRDAKWGLTAEVTRQQAKIGMVAVRGMDKEHCTPFQLLAWAHAGNATAAGLFKDFAAALAGKRMLYWSPGLKKAFAIADTDDEQIAADPRPDESRVGAITTEQLGQLHAHRALGEFIFLVATHCTHADMDANQAEIEDIASYLTNGPPPARGFIRVKRDGPGYSTFDPSRDLDDRARFLN
jgi:hypothetical protein